MIPQSHIDAVLARTDLISLVGESVALKQRGSNQVGLCPFHKEDSASFNVFGNDHYHCFGCGAHGNALDFLIEQRGMDFPEAVRSLSARAGIPMPAYGTTPGHSDQWQQLRAVLRSAAGEYQRQLMHAPDNAAAAELNRRGVDPESVLRFGIGYAPDAWSTLIDLFREIPPATLLSAGLVVERRGGNGHYDRFRDRLMFSITDEHGNVIGFGGRRLGSTDKNSPKYLNTPETLLYRKGNVLFGLPQALPSIRRSGRVIVVEGYFDVVSPSQHGIQDIVSTCGTALTVQHAEVLLRVAHHLVLCFDGDQAGRDAMHRAIGTVMPLLTDRHTVSLCVLPHDHDPDSLVRDEGIEAFNACLGASTTLCDFLVDLLSAPANTPEAVTAALQAAAGYFHAMRQAHVLRLAFRSAICARLAVPESAFRTALAIPSISGGTAGVSPCRYCGGPAQYADLRVHCLACGAAGPPGNSEAAAVAAWHQSP